MSARACGICSGAKCVAKRRLLKTWGVMSWWVRSVGPPCTTRWPSATGALGTCSRIAAATAAKALLCDSRILSRCRSGLPPEERMCSEPLLRPMPSALRPLRRGDRYRTSVKTSRCSAPGLNRLFGGALPRSLPRPFPVANLFLVDTFGVGVIDAFDDLILQPLFDVGADGTEARDPVDNVDRQVKAIDLVEDGKLEWRVDVALFLVSADMYVVMILATIAELVDERGIRVEVEDDGFVGGEKGIEVAIGESVRVFALWHEAEEIDDVDETDLQIREALLQDHDRRQRFHRCNISSTSHYHVGFLAVVCRSPVPNANALGTVGYRIFHVEVLKVVLLVRDNDINVVA